MLSSLKPFTTLTAFILLHISISSLQVVNAAPRPIPIALFDHELIQLEARHDCQNETANATPSSVDFKKQNGLDAQKLNAMFKSMKPTDACQDGQMACINSQFAQCISSKWSLTSCASGTSCFALPLVNKPGTSLVCDLPTDANARFEAAGVQGGPDGSGTGASDPNGDDDCDDEDPHPSPNGSPDDDGDCDDDVPSSSNAQPTPTGADPIIFTTVTTTVTLSATPTTTPANNLNVKRRQLITALPPSETQPSPFFSTPSSPPLSPPGVSSSSLAATPTVVIGQNGIVTVTVVSVSVSTVTVSASNCGPSSSPASEPTISPVAGLIPSDSPNTLVSSFSFTPGTVSPTQTPSSSSSPSAISLQAASTTTPSGGISFSTQVVTPTPAPGPNSSPTQNISELLTATIG